MNREEILKIPAGKKMNQLIWWKIFDMTPEPLNNDMNFLPDYSGDMNAAWIIVKKLGKGVFRLELGARNATVEFIGYSKTKVVVYGDEDVTPLAICRSALLCVLE